MKTYDVIIVGGGLSGLSQAILLAKNGFDVACVDREKPITQLKRQYDTRTTAISWGSRNVLREAGVWQEMEGLACPIEDIRIKDGDARFVLTFLSEEVEGKEFGWIVDNYDLRMALHNTAQTHENLTHITGDGVVDFVTSDDHVSATLESGEVLRGKLVIGCDGRASKTREKMGIGTWGHNYDQLAVVCLVKHEKPHNNVAVEHFLPAGPFASLPMLDDEDGAHRSAVVWSVSGESGRRWIECDEGLFNKKMNGLYGGLFGEVELTGTRAGWPLNIVMAYSYIKPRMMLMAEAAHGIHPIAGQGLNLSLRDVAALTEILVEAREQGQNDWGAEEILKTYQKSRRLDNTMMGVAMEGFNRLFSNSSVVLGAARKVGLRIVSRFPKFKRFFMTQAMGTVGHVPEMVRGRDEDVKDEAS